MDYEKKYNEALGRAKELITLLDKVKLQATQADIYEIFPELCESEDEMVRKALIDGVRQIRCKNGITQEQMLAYLEKQKGSNDMTFHEGHTLGFDDGVKSVEQKEQKPKHFDLKAGKWYICHRAFCCRADHLTVKEGERFMCEKDGIVKGFVIKEPEKYFKECSAPAPMEDEQKEQKPIIQDVELNDAVYDYVRDHFIAGADFTPEYIKKLMENAFFAGVDYYLLKQEFESCEPDTNVEKVIEDVIRVYGKTQGEWVGGYDIDALIVNLRRAFNKKEQKPVEEITDAEIEQAMDEVTKFKVFAADLAKTFGITYRRDIDWHNFCAGLLTYLKRVQPVEWSEEDKKTIRDAIDILNYEGYKTNAEALKSLRPSWKPSKEQMVALQDSIDLDKTVSRRGKLVALLEDLKKLM